MKKKVKTMLAMLLAVALFTAMLPLCASAAETLYEGDFGAEGNNLHWKLDDQGTLTISGKGSMSDPYTYIESWPWKDHNNEVNSIVVENGVSDIGPAAFSSFFNLTEVILPNTITTIANGAFSYCHELSNLTLPDSLTVIGDTAFEGCFKISDLVIPNSVTFIGQYAFYECNSLKELRIPDSVTTIGSEAFSSCTALEAVTLSKNLDTIPFYCFSKCVSLTQVIIPTGITKMDSGAFEGCTSLKNITIPDSVALIGYEVFSGCQSLENVNIPDGVEQIDTYAFFGCSSLKSITIPSGVVSILAQAYGYRKNYWFGTIEKIPDIEIRGYIGSEAERYAKENDIKFVPIGSIETPSPETTPEPTPVPTPEQTPTPAPVPTAAPTATPTAKPSVTPLPTQRPSDYPDVPFIPSPTSGPSYVPDPNHYPWQDTTTEPTATPTPTATPEPSAEPEPTAAPSVPQFTDVKADVWYAEPVKWAAEHNITSGYPDGGFHPDDTCTRAHIVTFLWKVAGAPSVEGDIGFSDVSEDSYYYQAALWAEQNGITSGVGDGLFGSDNSCTREQVVTMLYKAAGSPAVSGDSPFGDLEQDGYYYNAAIWAKQNGIVAGYPDGGFHPSDPCTRAQIMTMLYNYAGK